MTGYEQLLAGLRLRHIAPSEVTSYADSVRNGVKNSRPPEELWANIIPTLWVVDHLRALIGNPVRLTSIYRSEEYNRAVRGASSSLHMKNNAIDFRIEGVRPVEVHAKLTALRTAGMFRGGIGLYRTFVHVDTRGVNASW